MFPELDHEGLQDALWRIFDYFSVQLSDVVIVRCTSRFDRRRKYGRSEVFIEITSLHRNHQEIDRTGLQT